MSKTSTTNPLQFALRHLLVVMFLIAMVSAAAAPWLRDLTSGQWLRLSASLGVTAAAFVVVSLLHAQVYLRAKRQLGAIRWEVTGAMRGAGKVGTWLFPFYFLIAAILAATLLSAVSVSAPSEETTGFLLLLSLEVGVSGAVGVQWLRSPLNRLLLGENGIQFATTFTPWERVWCSWESGGKPTPILLRTAGWAIYELDVGTETEDSVAQFLLSRARPWENPKRPKADEY